jgi:hypothetical protein
VSLLVSLLVFLEPLIFVLILIAMLIFIFVVLWFASAELVTRNKYLQLLRRVGIRRKHSRYSAAGKGEGLTRRSGTRTGRRLIVLVLWVVVVVVVVVARGSRGGKWLWGRWNILRGITRLLLLLELLADGGEVLVGIDVTGSDGQCLFEIGDRVFEHVHVCKRGTTGHVSVFVAWVHLECLVVVLHRGSEV